MIVVSNTSPIINLAAIGKLEILQKLYEKIFIPQAVHYEISIAGKGKPGALEIEKLEWIEVKEVTNHKLVKALQMELDEGEAEAITLAIGLKSELLLLDEPQGRKVASNLGLNSTLTPKNQNLPIFGHFSPVISDVPTTFFPISSTRGGTAIPAALNPK